MSASTPILDVHPCPAVGARPTLTTVLARLRQGCSGVCSATTADLDPVSFAWRRTTARTSLVVPDGAADDNFFTFRRILHAVNVCTSTDRIRVVARREDDRGRAVAVVSAPASFHPTLVLA